MHPALRLWPFRSLAILFLGMGASLGTLHGQHASSIFIDASATVGTPLPVKAALGSSRRPDGESLTVNSQYLVLNGKPWLPVMGEFHYSRYPEQEWEPEILKMKSAGVQIVSTYIFWIHHEEIKGRFDWSGQRNLRHFVELCARHGLYVYPRIGPWAHGEVRNGGLPDWVVRRSPTRRNDPVYLAEVKTFYQEIGAQLQGLLWKDGGPVIGIQLENEYRDSGPGTGAAHIKMLKQMAIAAGLDVPLYTVTGWDNAAVPLDTVLPVFGGYPDAPWDRSSGPLPLAEVYSFRFENRAAGNMGAIGGGGQNSAKAYQGTPFLTAEIGGGMEDTYFRRPVIGPDDIAAMAPVMLGSGANLLGFYIFQGGRNPTSRRSTLQESQRTGYPTDVPVYSYDFQAPLSEFGEERESFKRLKLIDYFLQDFGSALAPMQVYPPSERPANPGDVSVARVSARADGEHAFIFFNNYVRGLAMPARKNFQVHLKLRGETLTVPDRPLDLPSGAYGIWPVNLDLDGDKLLYSTAQLFKLSQQDGDSYYFFFAIPGITPEFALAAARQPQSVSKGISAHVHGGVSYYRAMNSTQMQHIVLAGTTHPVHLIVLPRSQAEDLWKIDGSDRLLLTSAQFFSSNDQLYLRSDGDPDFTFSLFGKDQKPIHATVPLQQLAQGLFTEYATHLAPVAFQAIPTRIQKAGTRRPLQYGSPVKWSKQSVPLAPEDADFRRAAIWRIPVPTRWGSDLSNVFLQIDYCGDVVRLDSGGRFLDDNFWNGGVWKVGLKEMHPPGSAGSLRLLILPLPARYPMQIENADVCPPNAQGQLVDLKSIQLVPQYQLVLQLPK